MKIGGGIQSSFLFVAVGIGVCSSFGLLDKWISQESAILTLLAIVILDQIVTKSITLRNIEINIQHLAERHDSVLWKNSDLEICQPYDEFVRTSDDILLVGHSLLSQFVSRRNLFLSAAKTKTKIRVALLDPSSSAIDGIARSYGHSESWLKNEIVSTLELLRSINNELPKQNKISIRLLSKIPFANTEISRNGTEAKLRCGVYLYCMDYSEREYIVLTHKHKEFPTFSEQAEKMWCDAGANELSEEILEEIVTNYR